MPTNRIAIISSPTAAGYEDFCDQLANNSLRFPFYTKLFPAIMQGDRTEDSIIYALEQIYHHQDLFDAVVIIRGGGATSDLSCFDSYLLAASCAQFPLPIITGIGHERDETVLDLVAHTRAKTPTAVAEFLIENMSLEFENLLSIHLAIANTTRIRLQKETITINSFQVKSTYILKDWAKQQENTLDTIKEKLNNSTLRILKSKDERLDNIEKQINLISPENLLRKGYTFTIKDGKMVRKAKDLNVGDTISTVFSDGKKESIIK